VTTRGERRRRRRDPEWHTLKFLLSDGDEQNTPYVACVLYAAGYRTPEAIRRMTDEELGAVENIGLRDKARVRDLRARLNQGETS
jgi:hypothetical protein